MKPVFEIERNMLEQELGVKLPHYCWRETTNVVYLDSEGKQPFLKFEVSDDLNGLYLVPLKGRPRKSLFEKLLLQMRINNKVLSNTTVICGRKKRPFSYTLKLKHMKNWDQQYEEYKDVIEAKVNDSQKNICAFVKKYPNAECQISISGGKDSDMQYNIVAPVLKEMGVPFSTVYENSTNEIGKTYKHIKESNYEKLEILNPEVAFIPWLVNVKDGYLPTVGSRICCENFKENLLLAARDQCKEYIFFVGVRKDESTKRAKYEYDINASVYEDARKHPDKYKGKKILNVPDCWHRFAANVHFLDNEVWLYLLHNKIRFNELYEYGFNRTGCAICPYASAYNDYLIKRFFGKIWRRFKKALAVNYEKKNIAKLGWTLEEWENQKWKTGISKVCEITRLKKTPERVAEVMRIKNIDQQTAEMYFEKKCTCEHRLNPDEVAMNLKLIGRFQYQTSIFDEKDASKKRMWFCKKCLCNNFGMTQAQYRNMVIQFRQSDCALF